MKCVTAEHGEWKQSGQELHMIQTNRQRAECSAETESMSSYTVVMLKMSADANNDSDAGEWRVDPESAPSATQQKPQSS